MNGKAVKISCLLDSDVNALAKYVTPGLSVMFYLKCYEYNSVMNINECKEQNRLTDIIVQQSTNTRFPN